MEANKTVDYEKTLKYKVIKRAANLRSVTRRFIREFASEKELRELIHACKIRLLLMNNQPLNEQEQEWLDNMPWILHRVGTPGKEREEAAEILNQEEARLRAEKQAREIKYRRTSHR